MLRKVADGRLECQPFADARGRATTRTSGYSSPAPGVVLSTDMSAPASLTLFDALVGPQAGTIPDFEYLNRSARP
jgi:hypothetical protein